MSTLLKFPDTVITLFDFTPTYDKLGKVKPTASYNAKHYKATMIKLLIWEDNQDNDFIKNIRSVDFSCLINGTKFSIRFKITNEQIAKMDYPQERIVGELAHKLRAGFDGMDKRVGSELANHMTKHLPNFEAAWQNMGWIEKNKPKFFGDEIQDYKAELKKWNDFFGESKKTIPYHPISNNFGFIDEGIKNYHDTYKIERKARKLPGVDERALYPCGCSATLTLSHPIFDVIIHLNDKEKWSREKIADWLDELHDTGQINIEFDPWKDEE